jgi:hypothetical protein
MFDEGINESKRIYFENTEKHRTTVGEENCAVSRTARYFSKLIQSVMNVNFVR